MISELPGGRSGAWDEHDHDHHADEPGVSHREIIWRAKGRGPSLRHSAGRRLVLPWWLEPVVVLLVIGYLAAGVPAAPFSLEEAVQTTLAADAGDVVHHPGSLIPGAASTSATKDAARLGYGSLTRYPAAVGWYLAGGRSAQQPVDLSVPGRHRIRVPDWSRVVATRAGPALLGLIAVLLFFLLARRLFGRAAALAAVVAFGLHPTIALVTRQTVDAGLTLAVGLAAILVAVRIATTVAAGRAPALGAWTALGGLTGLTMASGATSPPYVAGVLAFCCAGLFGREVRRRRELLAGRPQPAPETGAPVAWMAVTALGAVLLWVAVSPALWGWLPQRLDARHAQQPVLVAERLLPDPGPRGVSARIDAGAGVLTDPFLTPAHLDQGTRLARYEHSWLSGLPLGTGDGPLPAFLTRTVSVLLGMVLTAAAVAGVAGLWRTSRLRGVAVIAWAVATAGWLVLSPSRQADHLTPLVVVACLLVAGAVRLVLVQLRSLADRADRGGHAGRTDQFGDDRG